jgi:SAM-dependent methyltransferase
VAKIATYTRAWTTVVRLLTVDAVRNRDRSRRFAGEISAFDRQGALDRWLHERPLSELVPGVDEHDVRLPAPWPTFGNVSVMEMVALCLIVKATCARRVLEIGTFDGRTALNLAANVGDDGTVTTIDLPPVEQERRRGSESGWVWDDRTDGLRAVPAALAERIRFVHADSTEFDYRPFHKNTDLVFIDGSHRGQIVRSDTKNACDCVRPGGCIVWHDAAPSKVGVLDALAGSGLPVVRIQGTTLAFYRAPE